MQLAVHDGIVGVSHRHQHVDVGVEMEVPNHRGQQLHDIRPAARTKPRRDKLDGPDHRPHENSQCRLVSR